MFTGWICDNEYILPILDNFIIPMDANSEVRKDNQGDAKQEYLDQSRRSWIFIFSVILTIFKFNEEKLLKMKDFCLVAEHFQNMQYDQKLGFENKGGASTMIKWAQSYSQRITIQDLFEIETEYFI